ncbi:HNH endonuclease [bacterium]|nr:HNH endonuclease [bacterium]
MEIISSKTLGHDDKIYLLESLHHLSPLLDLSPGEMKELDKTLQRDIIKSQGIEPEKLGSASPEEIIFSPLLMHEQKIHLLKILHNYSDEDIKELFKTAQKETKRAKLSEVKRKITQKTQEMYGNVLSDDERQPISDEVKMFVWQRDQGKCVKCGSQENLEFDHIIPFSKGGSNSKRNIQLLCEKCNRSKTDNII